MTHWVVYTQCMSYPAETYRHFLSQALASRARDRGAHTISAVARRLGVGRSFLSEVLAGKKNLSADSAAQIASRLGLSAEDSEYFLLLVQLGTHEDPGVRERALERIREIKTEHAVHDLTVDHFRSISEWYHLPILELATLRGFSLTPQSAARKLGVSIVEAHAAIERLVRLELLEKETSGKLRRAPRYVYVEARVPAEAVVRYQQAMLEKAARAMAEQNYGRRRGRTEVFPLDDRLLPEAEAILDRAAAQLTALARRSKSARRVYAACLHTFDLTTEKE